MHCNTHGTAGIAILITTYLLTKNVKKTYIIGGIIAFASHYILDFIGESGYRSMQELLSIETFVFMVPMVIMYFAGIKFLKISFFGFFMANLMDVIDKKMYLAILFPKRYSFTYYFHSKKQVLFNISYQATIGAAVFSMILVITCLLYLKYRKQII